MPRLSAFACFFFQDPSPMAFQRGMESRLNRDNLATMFGVEAIPSDSRPRDILDGAPADPLRRLLGQLFERYRRSGWASEFKTSRDVGGGLYPVILDGTDYYSSTRIGCERCLTSTHTREGKETTRQRHAVLSATLFKARSRQIPALDAEPIRNTDGAGKQDRELNAAKRLLPRFRREHPKLPVLLLGDAIHPHEPLLGQVGQLAMRYLLVVKPGSRPETFEWVEDLEAKREWVEHGRWTEGPVERRAASSSTGSGAACRSRKSGSRGRPSSRCGSATRPAPSPVTTRGFAT